MRGTLVPKHQFSFWDCWDKSMRLCQAVLFKERKRILKHDPVNGYEHTILAPSVADLNVLKPNQPCFTIGDNFVFSGVNEISTLNYHDMQRKNLCIASIPMKQRGWFSGQKVRYMLKRSFEITSNLTILDTMPPDHLIQYDRAVNRVRLVGHNTTPIGVGGWIYL